MYTPDAIREIVQKETIVVFAKGTKQTPRCGFSARTIEAVASTGKPFAVIDVLADPRIRPALVQFSQWPTTPQLYVGGELVGGCDITLELHASGELHKTIAAAFGEGYDPNAGQTEPRVELSDEAKAKLKEYFESADELLRLSVELKGGERSYSLSIDSRSSHADLAWTVDGIKVVVAKEMSSLFDRLAVAWLSKEGSEGFSVKEVGDAPALPLPLEITGDELKTLLDTPPAEGKLWIVDIREAQELASGQVEGAKHIPMSRFQEEWEDAGFDAKDTIVCFCAHGVRSVNVANFLRQQAKLPGARSLRGGLPAYPSQATNSNS